MNLEELKKLISGGESSRIEFKSSTGQRSDAAKAVCGMLNAAGGYVIFGINDTGSIVGQHISPKTLEDISNELRRIEPPAFPIVDIVTLQGKTGIIALHVPGLAGPYTYDGRAYLRQGPTTRIMPREEMERRLIERLHSTRRWENEPAATGVTIEDLDTEEIHTTLTNAINTGRMDRPRKADIRSILMGLGLIIDGHLLNAAVALYSKSKRLESLYPQCALKVARFRGSSRLADYIDNRQYWGNAFALLRRAESFLLDHMPVAGRVISGKLERIDRPLYPPRALREALANAFCHRDYAAHGGAVSVAMYDRQLEIINPGELHFGITPAKLNHPHESRPWNPIIANVFYRAGIIEKWGSGTLNIIDWCKGNSNPKPSWTEQSGSLVLKLFPIAVSALAMQKDPQIESRQESRQESQQESQQESLRDRVLLLLASGPMSRSEIVAKLGQKQLSRHLYNVMRSLLEEGMIAYTIPDKPQSRLQKYVLVGGITQSKKAKNDT